MEYQGLVENSECDTGVFSMDVAGQHAIRDSNEFEPETVTLGDRECSSTTDLFGSSRGRSSTHLRGNINGKLRNLSQSECCESSTTHGFECACLDKKSLPWSFRTMLGILCHILGYLLIPHALVKLDRRVGDDLSVSRLVPESTYLMQMGLDWDIQCIPSFLEHLFRYYGLERQVFCEIGWEVVDFVIALRPLSERMAPDDSSTPQAACESCVPICPVVVQHGPYDNPIARLRTWLSGHHDWLAANNRYEELWPMPYFLVDKEKWTFGFVAHSESGFKLYDEFIGSMGWKNGIRKIVVILKLVIESTIKHHRQWSCGRALQELSSDDEDYHSSEKLLVSPKRIGQRSREVLKHDFWNRLVCSP